MEIGGERQSSFDTLREQREKEGWSYVGLGQLVETQFIDGRFTEVPVRTKEEVIAEKVEKLQGLIRQSGQEKDVTVELVDIPGEIFDGVELPNKAQSFYIFAKIK